MNDPQQQDLRLSVPRKLAPDWRARSQVTLTPSADRLSAAHSVVTIRNTSQVQRHVVIDRHMIGHELQPGQEKHGIEMLNSEIETFIRERQPGRVDAYGNERPKHPIEIVDARAMNPEPLPATNTPIQGEQQRRAKDGSRT